MARRFNWRLIKMHHSYTIEEAARTLGAHKNTVWSWVRGKQLSLVCDRRPYLIHGRALRDFLATEQAARKQRCGPGRSIVSAAAAAKTRPEPWPSTGA